MLGGNMLDQSAQLLVTPQVSADLQTQIEYWDRYIGEEFAMAPTHRRYDGSLTAQEYHYQGRAYSRTDRKFMLPEIRKLCSQARMKIFTHEFRHYGGGHGDDCGYVPDLLTQGFQHFSICDISGIARVKTAIRIRRMYRRKALRSRHLPDPESYIRFGELEEEVAESEFSPDHILACKVGRILQHFEPSRFSKVVRNLGKLVSVPGQRLFLIHHCAEDELNKGYKYKTSYPYTRSDILRELRQTAGQGVDILHEAHLWYFNYQYYSFMSIGQRANW